MERRELRRARHVAPAALLALLCAACAATPRTDRVWSSYFAHAAHVERGADGALGIAPVSDWTYDARGPVTRGYQDAAVDPGAVRGVWFLQEPNPAFPLVAHTLFLFELSGDRLLGVTVEARLEAHERYSAVRGVWNAYELSYIWATARDLTVRRAVMLGHPVYVYPLSMARSQARDLFERMADRTERLETRPRFYNTLGANCTSEPLSAARLPWSPAFVVTGRADRYLFGRGLIRGRSFGEAKRRADVTALVRDLAGKGLDDAAFDAALLRELRARQGERKPAGGCPGAGRG